MTKSSAGWLPRNWDQLWDNDFEEDNLFSPWELVHISQTSLVIWVHCDPVWLTRGQRRTNLFEPGLQVGGVVRDIGCMLFETLPLSNLVSTIETTRISKTNDGTDRWMLCSWRKTAKQPATVRSRLHGSAWDHHQCKFRGRVHASTESSSLGSHQVSLVICFRANQVQTGGYRLYRPRYLTDMLRHVADVLSRSRLRSSTSNQLVVRPSRLISVALAAWPEALKQSSGRHNGRTVFAEVSTKIEITFHLGIMIIFLLVY